MVKKSMQILNIPDFTQGPTELEAHARLALDVAKNHLESAPDPTAPFDVLHKFVREGLDKEEALSRAMHQLSHLNATLGGVWRAPYEAMLAPVSAYESQSTQDDCLYAIFGALMTALEADKETKDKADLARLVHLKREQFERLGVALDSVHKDALTALQADLSKQKTTFANQLTDSSARFALVVPNEVAHKMSPGAQAILKQDGRYIATLNAPAYLAIMKECPDRSIRYKVHKAFATRATESDADNAPVIGEILRIRRAMADILGYKSHAHFSLSHKMAAQPSTALDFLHALADLARPYAQKEYADLCALGVREGLDAVMPWDVAYLSELHKKEILNLDAQSLRPYFEKTRVVDGVLSILGRLFDVEFVVKATSTYHADVQYIELMQKGQCIGACYLDLHARDHKRAGAWMGTYAQRHTQADGTLALPVCFVVANFTPKDDAGQCHLTHDEVVTFLHEMGHALHHLLTRATLSDISGISQVEWDAVELPSQWLEGWAYDRATLNTITTRPLDDATYTALHQSRIFQSGLMTLRQIEFALADLYLHLEAKDADDAYACLYRARNEVAQIQAPDYDRFLHGFAHIFAGGYAAGYYSYKWAQGLSADVFERFLEAGLDNASLARRFLDAFLGQGSRKSAACMVREFLGRDMDEGALARASGFV